MLRFGLKDLFYTTTLIAAGLSCLGLLRSVHQTLPNSSIGIWLFIGAGAFIGAGILFPFKAAWLGALIGPLASLALMAYLTLTV